MSESPGTPDPRASRDLGELTLKSCPHCGHGLDPSSHHVCSSQAAPTVVVSPPSRQAPDETPPEAREFLKDPTRLLNQYILVRVLGKGGMGEVWKAWDRRLTRWVAIKFLIADTEEGVLRFDREAKLAARLSHPNIAPVHEVGEAPSQQPGKPLLHFLAMEFINGGSLAESKLSLKEHLEIFVSVASALEAAHRMNVVHRDIKPQNIMVTQGKWPYVMDFGLAKSVDSDSGLSVTGAVLGTPAFMSPEQVEGDQKEIGPAADLYSLGATMYAVFCQTHPFNAKTTLQLLQKVCTEAPPPPREKNKDIPPRLEALILKAMAKKAKDRFSSAQALGEELKAILRELEAAAPAPAPAPPAALASPAAAAPPRPIPTRKPLWPILVGAAAVLLLGILGLGYLGYRWLLGRASGEMASLLSDPKRETSSEEIGLLSADSPERKKKIQAPDRSKIAPVDFSKRTLTDPPVSETGSPKPPTGKIATTPPAPPLVSPTAAEALKRASEFLAAHYREVDFSSESDYWAALALLRTGQAEGDPALKARIFRFLERPEWIRLPHPIRVAAIRSQALLASRNPALKARAAEAAQALIDVQGTGGGFSDEAALDFVPPPPPPSPAPAFILAGDEGPQRFSLVARGGPANQKPGDLEATRWALWALLEAAACGHQIPPDVYTRALRAVEDRWNEAGSSWMAQENPPRPDAPLTLSGIEALCLARRGLGDPEGGKSRIARASLAWLASRLALGGAGGVQDPKPISYLSQIERLGALLGSPVLGPHEWYPLGARYLLGAQNPDGSWKEANDTVGPTALGILFLIRQTSLGLEESGRGGTGLLETRSLGGCSNIMCILDASGRMRQEMDQQERFEAARGVIADLAGKLPDGAWFGLRVFGHRHLAIEPGSDHDSELVIPFGPLNRTQIRSHLGALRVRGGSVLTFSLIETVNDLTLAPADLDVAVVLLIDGSERNPKANPVPATGDLAGSRRNLKVHVVGFNAEDEPIDARLRSMAEAGNGRYIRARHRDQAVRELLEATVGERDYVLLGEKGEEVARGQLGDRRPLPDGRYTFACGQGASRQETPIWINPGLTARILVNQEELTKKR